MEKSIEGKITDRQLMMFADGELTKEEREKEMERLCDELIEAIDNGPHPSPIPTPEQIRARNKAFKDKSPNSV